MPSFGLCLMRACMALPTAAVRAPPAIARSRSRLRVRRRAGLTLLRTCFDGRVKALMWRRSSSGIFHHGTLSEVVWVPTASSAGGGAGEWV